MARTSCWNILQRLEFLTVGGDPLGLPKGLYKRPFMLNKTSTLFCANSLSPASSTLPLSRAFSLYNSHTTLLMKWVDKIMGLRDGLDISILSNNYNSGLNWENRSGLFRRASPYWQGLRQTFSPMCEFFITRLGDGLEFQLVECLVAVRNFEGCIFALIRSYKKPQRHNHRMSRWNMEADL